MLGNDTNPMNKLRIQRNLILQDYDSLEISMTESEKSNTVSYTSFSGFFVYLQAEFDDFSTLIKGMEAPDQNPELLSIKEEVSTCFNRFYRLRARFYNTVGEHGEIIPAERELPEEQPMEPKEAEEDQEEAVSEEDPDAEEASEDTEETEKTKKRRIIRPPVFPVVSVHYTSEYHPIAPTPVPKQLPQENHGAATQHDTPASERTTPVAEVQENFTELSSGVRTTPSESSSKPLQVAGQGASQPNGNSYRNAPPQNNSPANGQAVSSSGTGSRSTKQQTSSTDPECKDGKPASPVKPKYTDHHYQLERITRSLGNGVYATMQRGVHQAASRTDNDVIRMGLNTSYYVSTGMAAAGMVGGMIRAPTAGLKASSVKVMSPKQMSRYNAGAIRRHRDMELRISSLEQQLSALDTMRMRPSERRLLENQLKELRSQLPSACRAARLGRKVNSFQRERNLDQAVLDAITVDGKIPRKARALQELGNGYIRTRGKEITKRYGDTALMASTKGIEKDIRRKIQSAQALKSQIALLERRGKSLTLDERKHLVNLKKQMKELGKKIGDLKSLKQALEDQNYIVSQVDKLVSAAYKQRQNTLVAMGFFRGTLLRPLYQPDNNTQALAYGLNFAMKPSVIRGTAHAVKAVGTAPGKILYKVAPEVSTRIQFEKQQAKKKLAEKARNAGKNALKKAPQKMQSEVAEALERRKKHREKINTRKASRLERKKKIRKRFAKTRTGRFIAGSSELMGKISEFLHRMAGIFRGILTKAAMIILVSVLILSIIPMAISVITGVSSSVVLSPHDGEDGKIDLAPFVAVIEQENRKFTARRDDLEQQFYDEVEKAQEVFNKQNSKPPKIQIIDGPYEDKDSKVNVSFDGPANNSRELIAMMAVRFQQDLEDPNAMHYLRYLAEKGRVLDTIQDKTFHHSPGCVTIQEEIPPKDPKPDTPKPKPGGDGSHVVPGVKSRNIPRKNGGSHVVVPTKPTEPPEPTYEQRKVCPGHRVLDIHIHTLTLEELYEADDFPGVIDGWEGWTEDNRQWVEALLSMDWAELYVGFRTGGMISVSSPISSEEEQHIWDYLNNLTGNPYGAAGIMGNMHCESRLLSTNLEDQYEGILGYDDSSYTAAVDNGTYQNFITDAAGYGLCQWTYHARKAGLLKLAQSRGTSIGDMDMQLDFLASELHGSGLNLLSSCGSVAEASDYMLFTFENPANASSLRETRLGISNYYYNKFVLGTAAEGDLTQAQIDVIEIATHSDAYGIPARGGYCQAWAANVYGRAGMPIDNSSCARVSGERYGVSSDFSIVPPGAAVYGYSSSRYGHVGIYVGGGQVYHNVGGVAVDSLSDWVRKYNGFVWGWEGGSDLTALP